MALPEFLIRLANKANIYSPIFTGVPQAPTASAGTNTSQLATTQFVTTAVANKTTITGNAGTATKLATARNIVLSGDVTGTASFNGTADANITATVVDDSHLHSFDTVTGLSAALNAKAAINNPTFTGQPKAPTASSGTNTTQLATTAFVTAAINAIASTMVGGVLFKGTLGLGGTYPTLPTSDYNAGWLWKVIVAGTYAGQVCEIGDMVVATADMNTVYSDDDFTVIQANVDGAVTGPTNAVNNRVVVFNGSTGKVIKDSGFTIDKSVPSNAVFTDTVYTHPNSEVSAGTYKSVTVNSLGHVTAGTNPTTLAAYGITDAAPKDSPALTGTPTVPTATAGTNNTQVASTAFVTTAVANKTTITGNAGTATKLATARTIDGVSFDGSNSVSHYGVCATAAAVAAKVVDCTGFTLSTGAMITVKFSIANTANAPTLNVNGTGAKAIRYRGSAILAKYLASNSVYDLVYDGTAYEVRGHIGLDTAFI